MSSPERCSATRVTSQRSLPPRSAVPSRGYKTGGGRGSRSVAERAARRTDARERARGCGTYACYVPRSYGRRVSPRRSNQEERLIGTRQPRGFNMSMKKESPWDVELHLAAARGDAKRLRILLDSGRVHVDCKDKDGTTPLILAAAGGHIDAVTELLHQGADSNAKRLTGTTALFFAAQGGYMDIASLLLEHGAIVDSCSIDGGTPLFVACQYGHLDVVEGLIERGASPNAHMKDGATALFIAAQNGHLRILEVLLERGAKTDAARTDGATPLWIASQMGHDHIVRRLLKAGAKVDATRHDGATPLFKAAHKGHTAVIGELLKYRPSLGVLPNGESALHAAALTGHMTVARQLVGAGADPLLVNQEGITPLQLAVRHSQTQVANYLRDKVRVRTASC